MTHLLFFFSVNLLLISRLRLTFRDNGADAADQLKMTAISLIPLAFIQFSTGWIVLFIYLIISPVIAYKLEKDVNKRNRNRLIVLFVHFAVYMVIFSSIFAMNENNLFIRVHEIAGNLLPFHADFSEANLLKIQVLLFGLLMVINEMNILLRYLLNVSGLEPLADTNQHPDAKDYKTGRIIGVLERIFVLIFAISNQFAAIGIILAAKGITRFKEFENRSFAEYVLIGTLLSTLLALAVAFLIRGMLA